MSKFDLLRQIAQAKLTGRGGAAFPVADKWQRIQEHQSEKKYVVCNASEGEPGVKKDFYILQHFPERVIQGMVLAMDFLGTKEAYLYLNRDYHAELKERLEPLFKQALAKGFLINLFLENPSYIGGESGALLNTIEGKKTQPRNKPPSPSITGINGAPVLLHNVETFYDIALVAAGKYLGQRFVTISGGQNDGVFALKEDLSVAEALRLTANESNQAVLVQVGGGASGPVFSQEQLTEAKLTGCASLEIYPASSSAKQLLQQWADFYATESCGKCTPCREGTWQVQRLVRELGDQEPTEAWWQTVLSLARTMQESSICGLGQSLIIPLQSYYENIWSKKQQLGDGDAN